MVDGNTVEIPLEDRIVAPITWDIKSKFKIQDLRDDKYKEVLLLIKRHYFRDEAMCRSIKLLDDPDSVEEYMKLIQLWMRDTTSFVAISLKSGRVVGAVINRIIKKEEFVNTYSCVRIINGSALQLMMDLKKALIIKAEEKIDRDTYYQVYVLIVHPSYRAEGVGEALLDVSAKFAVKLKIPLMAGMFTTEENQTRAYNVGFTLATEILYATWIVNNDLVFNNTGENNNSAIFMTKLLPSEETQ